MNVIAFYNTPEKNLAEMLGIGENKDIGPRAARIRRFRLMPCAALGLDQQRILLIGRGVQEKAFGQRWTVDVDEAISVTAPSESVSTRLNQPGGGMASAEEYVPG